MTIATKMREFNNQSSWIRRMFEEGVMMKQRYGAAAVFDFSLGNPNIEPPRRFKELLAQTASADIPGSHGYMPNAGYPETRAAVAAQVSKEQGVSVSAEHIIMTCGAAGAVNVTFRALLDPGDEVIIPKPFFAEYPFYVDNAGGTVRFVATRPDFSLNLAAIAEAIGARTKAVLLNSPHNPTGTIYDEASLQALGELLRRRTGDLGHEIYLIADEPYRAIVYDGAKVPALFAAYEHSIICTSYSKSLSLAGERIGYLAVNPATTNGEELLGAMVMCNRILGFVNAPALMQRVIAQLQDVQVDVSPYKRKRDLLCDGLAAQGYEIAKPAGAFYLFPPTPIPDDVQFVKLLQKRRILTTPGVGFGCPGYFRISYCVDDTTIINAMEGFGEALREVR